MLTDENGNLVVDPDVITEAIEGLAAAPKKVTNAAGESIEEHSLTDMIALQKQVNANSAVDAAPKSRGLRFNRIITGDHR